MLALSGKDGTQNLSWRPGGIVTVPRHSRHGGGAGLVYPGMASLARAPVLAGEATFWTSAHGRRGRSGDRARAASPALFSCPPLHLGAGRDKSYALSRGNRMKLLIVRQDRKSTR